MKLYVGDKITYAAINSRTRGEVIRILREEPEQHVLVKWDMNSINTAIASSKLKLVAPSREKKVHHKPEGSPKAIGDWLTALQEVNEWNSQ